MVSEDVARRPPSGQPIVLGMSLEPAWRDHGEGARLGALVFLANLTLVPWTRRWFQPSLCSPFPSGMRTSSVKISSSCAAVAPFCPGGATLRVSDQIGWARPSTTTRPL